MKFNISYLVAMMCASLLGIVSCGPDPEPEPGPSGGDAAVGTWIINGYIREGDKYRLSYDSECRVIGLMSEAGLYETYSYSETLIKLLENGNRPDMYWAVKDRLAINCYDNSYFNDEYEYDFKRQLVKMLITEEDGRYEDEYNFMWESGNIVSVKSVERTFAYQSTPNIYTLKYGERGDINPGCVTALNRLAMNLLFGLYPSVSLSGYFGKVPEKLIAGLNKDVSEGMPSSIAYGDIDANGCPQRVSLSYPGLGDDTIFLTWRKL